MDSSTVVEKGIIAPMTTYEKLAIALSVIAILIPIIQWAWKKWVTKPILKHLATGRAYLFFNKSGSYLRFEGVFEAERKPITVKNIELKVVNKQNSHALNLSWSVFTSPVNQQIVGNYAFTTETAHPFRVEEDSVVCAFIEFTDFYESAAKAFNPFFTSLFNEARSLQQNGLSYEEAYSNYIKQKSYDNARNEFYQHFFWAIGEYLATLEVEYGKKKVRFIYEFEVNESTNERLMSNLNETLLIPLKSVYGMQSSMQSVPIAVREAQKK